MLPYDGDGSSGLAILALQETEKESYSREPLMNHRIVRDAFPSASLRDSVLRATLLKFGEPKAPNIIEARSEQFRELAKARNIRTVVTIGTLPLRAVSRVHGKAAKLLGSTIAGEAFPYIIPLDDERTGPRALRSYSFRQALARFMRRGLGLARKPHPLFSLPRVVTGEGDEALAVLQEIATTGLPVGLDLETAGEFPNLIITAMGIANKHVSVSVPWTAYESKLYGRQPGLQRYDIREAVLSIIASDLTKLVHNGAFDFTVLRALGFDVGGEYEDTMLAARINRPDLFRNLQFCMAYEVPIDPWKTRFEQGRRQRHEPKDDWAETRYAELLPYNAWDAGVMPFLWECQAVQLNETPRGWDNYRRMKRQAGLFSEMRYHGIAIDEKARTEELKAARARIDSIRARWDALAPDVDPGSNKQCANFFFNKLHAPVITRSKASKEANLPSSTLLEYAYSDDAPLNEVAWTLFEYRKIRKATDAFLEALPRRRAYADANVAGTKGTRASYSSPNLQQISKPKELTHPLTKQPKFQVAPPLRHLFVPDPGMVMWELDYSALELRLVAMAAGMTDVLDIIADPSKDLHMIHVELMFRRKIDKDSKEGKTLRQITKQLTYALFYNKKRNVETVFRALKPNMPALTMAKLEECADLFHAARPQLGAWQGSVEAFVRQHGYVELPLTGERQYHDRRFPDMNQALSYGIQSTGGDIMNAAMLRIQQRLDWERGERLLIQVHDSLVGQAPVETYKHVVDVVQEEMERPVHLWGAERRFPVEGGVGNNWRDIVPVAKFQAISAA